MPLTIDPRVTTGDGQPLPQDLVLPPIAGADYYHDEAPDRIGNALRTSSPAILSVSALGAAAGVGMGLLRHQGVVRTAALGAGGLALGGALALAAAVVVGSISGTRAISRDQQLRADAGESPATRDGAPSESLRVMTLNMRSGLGDYDDPHTQEQRWRDIEALVRREHPDVLLLQEVSTHSPVNGFGDNVSELQQRLDPTGLVFAPGATYASGAAAGTAVLTFGGAHIEDARDLRIPDINGMGTERRARSLVGLWSEVRHGEAPSQARWSVYQPRNATDALIVTAGGNRVRALSTHLSGGVNAYDVTRSDSQDMQLRPLADAISGVNASPDTTILTGDFNIHSDKPEGAREAAILGDAGMHDAFTSVGLALDDRDRISRGSGSRIDRIYATDDVTVRSIDVLRDPQDQVSDHRAVVADLTIL